MHLLIPDHIYMPLTENKKTLFLTACDDGDPSATESTRRKAFRSAEISGNHRWYIIYYVFIRQVYTQEFNGFCLANIVL